MIGEGVIPGSVLVGRIRDFGRLHNMSATPIRFTYRCRARGYPPSTGAGRHVTDVLIVLYDRRIAVAGAARSGAARGEKDYAGGVEAVAQDV